MFAECCIEIVVWNLHVDHDDHDYFLTSNVDIYSFFQGLIPGMKYSYHVQSGSNISDGFEFTAKRDDEVTLSYLNCLSRNLNAMQVIDFIHTCLK